MEGATRGFAQSVLSGGDLDQIFTNTITGGLNAQITGQLPDILNNGDHGFSFGLMLGHGIVQGVFSAIRGGKFKTGFISGAASKISSATINETPLSQADPFIKMSVTTILSGMASKASGGDFVQGAMSAMVVWLYNEMGSFDPLFGAPSDMMQPVYKFFDSLFGEKPQDSTNTSVALYDGNIEEQIAEKVDLGDRSYEALAANRRKSADITARASAVLLMTPNPAAKGIGKALGSMSMLMTYEANYYEYKAGEFDKSKFILDVVTTHTEYCKIPLIEYGYDTMFTTYIPEYFNNN